MLTDRSRIARPSARKALCSSLAIATALIVGSGMAQAQSLQGNGVFASGTGTIGTATGTTTVNLTSSDAVIDWTTFDTAIGGGPINFQPAATTATFQSTADFSVLNRILPTDPSRAVQFNGNIIAQIQGRTATPGGSVYFYSPGGIIVGSTAVFNVGNLGLTSIAPEVVGGVFEQGSGSKFVRFNGAVTPGSSVTIQAGAQITASGGAIGNYVAIVAPVISQRGRINVNGVAALVSADAATITFNPTGLFDIQVTSGTSGNLGGFNSTLFNDGTITGPAYSGIGALHRVYMVAVPKNTAITMAINGGSSLGFAIAGAADVNGNAVVLSAGRDIVGGNIASGPSAGGGTGAADLNIAGSTITSALIGSSTRDTSLFSTLAAPAAPTTHAYSTVSLQGDTSADIAADGTGTTVTIDGAVTLTADRTGGTATGGTTQIFAINNGNVTLGNGATLTARGFGNAGSGVGVAGQNGTGGLNIIQALSGGDIAITGGVTMFALGQGGNASSAAAGNGLGGRSQIFARDSGSSVTITGIANVFANGQGGFSTNGAGGTGTGGQALINAQVAASSGIAITGATTIQAAGQGGGTTGGPAGAGIGGNAVAAASVGNSVQFGSTLNVFANGGGGTGTGGNAGNGNGGNARIDLSNAGTMTVGGNTQVVALGAAGGGNVNSATATGGTAFVGSQQNSSLGVTGFLAVSSGTPTTPTGTGTGVGGLSQVVSTGNSAINVSSYLRLRSAVTAPGGGNATGGNALLTANTGGNIIANELNIMVDGTGGADIGGGAGFGRGGTATLQVADAGSRIAIANGNSTGIGANGDLFFITARGFGGQSNGGGSGVGGSAFGGNVSISATNGATLNGPANVGTRGFVQIFARAFAGDANTGASAGGAATGGNINITVDNATFTSAELLPSSFAQAGSALPTATGTINGGNAVGGTRNITVRNGATLTTAFSGGGPGAQGGNATLSGRGGDASGGSASLVVDNATLTLTGRATVFSQNLAGAGGTTGNVTAGTAFGQVSNGAVVNVFDDTASANDDFSISANAFGALSPATPGTAQGTVTAGTATLLVQGGTIQGAGTVGVGTGAFAQSDQYAQGGAYRGGTATLQVQGGTISVAQILITANAEAAAVGAGLSGTGGSATGGTARLQLNGATLSGTQLTVQSLGLGGSIVAGGAGDGGAGTGGLATIDATSGTNRLTYSRIDSIANGKGGDVSGTAGNGGAGVGGIAQINVTGGATLTVNTADSFIKANGEGGNSLSLTGNGGAGNAGRAVLSVDGGSATFNGNVGLSGESVGGNGINGGNAFGDPESNLSRAVVFARNGSLMVTGQTILDARAFGGLGNAAGNGGIATGGFANVLAANNLNTTGNGVISLNGLDIDSAAFGGGALGTGNGGNAGAGGTEVFVNGGTITIGGNVNLFGDAHGGDGINGGNAISARSFRSAVIGANNGTISVAGSTILGTDALGGDGRLSGTGGIAFAGLAVIDTSGNNGPSAINLAGLALDARAFGGDGGSAVPGQAGGTGGEAYGGSTSAFGVAGRGVLTVTGGTTIDATAFGGTGGQGHTGGTTAPGTAGGAGGRAFGGAITVGTRSGNETPTNSGSATFRLVTGNAGGFGGAGGAGGSGTTQGAGGSGGTGAGGSAGILVRGSPATFGDVTFTANGVGGNGGAGSVRGNGGDGYAGDGFVIATQRFLRTERGSLDAGNVTISSTGIGGTGATTGGSFFSAAQGAEGDFFVRQADVRIANLSITSSGALAPNVSTTVLADDGSGIVVATPITIAAEPFDLNMANGTVNISGALILATPGEMRVSLDASTLNTATLTLSAGNFVLPASAPAVVGTINVSNSLSLSTQRDFRIYANLVSAAPITISALTGAVATGNLQATGDVDITAGLGIATGAVMASQRIHLDAGGTITTGALVAGDAVNASAGGALNVASASAGIVNPSTNAFVDYVVTLRSLVSVNAGNLSAQRYIGLASPGAITVGNLSAGLGVLALAGTGLTTGSIATGLSGTPADPFAGVYLANFSMEPLGGGQIGRHFDPAPILALPPVAIGGPISITGAITTAGVRAAATGAIATQAITVAQSIDISGGAAITAGQLTAGDTVEVDSVGALNVAGASAGIVNPSTDPFASYNVGLRSLTSVVVGNVSAKTNFGVSSPGSIAVGNVNVGQIFLALPGTSLTTGSLTTSLLPNSRVYIANFSMEALGGQVAGNFNPVPILAANPVATGGPITINGPVSTIVIQANTFQSLSVSGDVQTPGVTVLVAGTTLNAANITVGDRALIAAGGNITLGNVNAGITLPSSGLRKIAIGSSTGTVTTGNLAAGFDLGIQAGGGISTGTLLGRQILLLAGSNVSTGAISAVAGSQPVGPVYIGNFSMANQTSNVFQTFTGPTGAALPIFNLQPVRIGGAITIGGAVSAGSLFAAAAQGIGLQAVTTPAASTQTGSGGFIDLDSGGTVTVNARLAAGNRIDIASRDIDITQTGSLDALSSTGEILLASNNPNGAFIGDGLTTTSGYMLSNAEYGRLRAGNIAVVGEDIGTLATDLTIGTLTINAAQLYGANGVALFASGNRATQTPSGILRIAGAVTGTGFAATNKIDLLSGTVELEAVAGSLKVDNGSGGLGGLIVIEAKNIHIASDAILTKLRADPLYTGHIDELNAPAAVQRPDGVLSAAALDLSGNQTIYIQNTGTSLTPAGFLTTFDKTDIGPHGSDVPPGSVNLVINGQLQTSTGIVTGKAAFDLAIAKAKADSLANGETFASDIAPASTFNGCVIVTGVCAFGQSDPVAALSSEISVVTNATLDESPVAPAADDSDEGDDGSSDKDDEDSKADEGSSPIAPPTPLISTRALDGDVNVVEPVSGAGNPALFGSAVDETTVQGEKP